MAQRCTYDSTVLSWNQDHTKNEENKYCYCGAGWQPEVVQLHCQECKNWFHGTCVSVSLKKTLRFMVNYSFLCADCNEKGTEEFSRSDAGNSGAAVTTLHHLTLAQKNQDSTSNIPLYFGKKEIIQFVEDNWEALWGYQKARPTGKSSWWASFVTCLMRSPEELFCTPMGQPRSATSLYGLTTVDSYTLTPLLYAQSKRKADDLHKDRRTKKVADGETVNLQPPQQSLHPFNRDGFRYTLAEEDPFTPDGFRLAGYDGDVMLAAHDRAPQLKIADDGLTVTGDRGYCMIRATHGVNFGAWYYEATLLDGEQTPDRPGAHTRIGWSQKYGNLQGPCGYDMFSYSWRDSPGSKFHCSKGAEFGLDGYGPGDVLGLFIEMPMTENSVIPTRSKDEKAVEYKGRVYFEEKDNVDKSKILPCRGSRLVCFKNGVSQGVMFEDIFEGTYYPAVSLYMGAKVRLNFGPNFAFPPKDLSYKPFNETVFFKQAQITLGDLLDKVGNIVTKKNSKASITKPA